MYHFVLEAIKANLGRSELLVFLAGVIAIVVAWRLRAKEQSIKNTPPEKRGELIERMEDALHIDTAGLEESARVRISEQILLQRYARSRLKIVTFAIVIAMFLTAAMTIGASPYKIEVDGEERVATLVVRVSSDVLRLSRTGSKVREDGVRRRGDYLFFSPIASNAVTFEALVRGAKDRSRLESFECTIPRSSAPVAIDIELASCVHGVYPMLELGPMHTRSPLRMVNAIVPSENCEYASGWMLTEAVSLYKKRAKNIVITVHADGAKTAVAYRIARGLTDRRLQDQTVAVAGHYYSSSTEGILEGCGQDCGAILTFASSVGLRSKAAVSDGAPPLLFRFTSDNTARAKDIVATINDYLLENHLVPGSEVQIIYSDDSVASDLADAKYTASYALDQALQLRYELREKNLPSYWVLVRKSEFFAAEPESGSEQRLDGIVGYKQLAQYLGERRAKNKIVVLIALDTQILDFGAAMMNISAPRPPVYIPGPREVFDGIGPSPDARSRGCKFDRMLYAQLDNVIALGPDDKNRTSVQAREFYEQWDHSHAESTPGISANGNAMRMYDALKAIDDAVGSLNNELAEIGVGAIGIDIYRWRLREKLQLTRFNGVSGSIAFDENGDLLARNYVIDMHEKAGTVSGRVTDLAGVAPCRDAGYKNRAISQ